MSLVMRRRPLLRAAAIGGGAYAAGKRSAEKAAGRKRDERLGEDTRAEDGRWRKLPR
jgi:hypothetical protein